MRGLRACWPWPVIVLIFSLLSCTFSEAQHHQQKLPSTVVVGTVYCDTCFQDDVSKGSHYISGATVAVECKEASSRPAFYQEVKTDKQGTFRVLLPFSVSKHVKEIEGCSVKLVKSSEPYCAVASTATSSAIHLKERKRGRHIFSAGFFTFKPLKQPELCNQQPSVTKSQLNSLQDLLPKPEIPTKPNPNPNPVQSPLKPVGPNLPLMPDLPPLPQLPPLPPLPTLPGLPGFLTPTIPQKPVEPSEEGRVQKEQVLRPQQFFPPIISPPPSYLPPLNPLQPPPLLPNPFQPPAPPLIPNPFQPPAPPTGFLPPLPPIPPLPRLPPLPPLPPMPYLPVPIPGVTPPPYPSTPPPTLPLPPVPVPLPPVPPLVPGVGVPIPPAAVNPKKATP